MEIVGKTGSEPIVSEKPLEAWRNDIREAMSRGELLQAFDLAERALDAFPEEVNLRYAAVLALARMGATRQARIRYNTFKLGEATKGNPALLLDLATLDARIAKDVALGTSDNREAHLADAAERYETIFQRSGEYYPGINAASLWLLAGDINRAGDLAKDVLARCENARRTGADSYYIRATEAEANLVLARHSAANSALQAASSLHGDDLSAVATTRRQLRLVCKAHGFSEDFLAPLAPPSVIHYTGHVAGPRFHPSAEDLVRAEISALVDQHRVGFGYGSLAAGADILFAEELLKRNAELHIAMPFNAEEFKRVSVAPSGEGWLARFEDCWRRKTSVTYATDDEYLGDDSLFGYASRIAMGLALLRAQYVDAPVRQIAVWDGGRVGGADPVAGAAADVAFWRKRKLPSDIIDPIVGDAGSIREVDVTAKPAPSKPKHSGRSIRAILFGDVKGFSALHEAQLRIFADEVLGRVARVLVRHSKGILFRNTWGDGVYIVVKDVETAAACAVELQEEMTSFTPAAYGLPEYLALRIGGHLGPVFRLRDPVLKRFNFIGSHVSRAARIEPVTPEGAVYVTEAFAAVLAASRSSGFSFEYVGQVPAAKHYGTMRMYSLRRSQ